MPLSRLRQMMDTAYSWTKGIDYSQNDALARVWYVSEEKLEPRLGERFKEPIEPYEQPLAPGRDAVRAMKAIDQWIKNCHIAGICHSRQHWIFVAISVWRAAQPD